MISGIERGTQRRTELLLGKDNLDRIAETRVLIFGLGGVGSWCAESLVRSGIRKLTIVDSDRVCVTNCNRQLMATTKTVGEVKVEALRNRLLEINPNAQIEALQKIYEPATADSFHMEDYDFIIDAIDSLSEKADLILRATSLPKHITFISSMGAALRIDPFQVRKAEFWKVKGDPLARAIRKKFKKQKVRPARKFFCVYSEEKPMSNMGENHSCGTSGCMCPKAKLLSGVRGTDTAVYDAPGDQSLVEHEWCTSKAQINGSLCHITAIFGMAITGIVLNEIVKLDSDAKNVINSANINN
ncbi:MULTISPECIES: tRNA threonylcarbamoyladenosine dehydratase [Segatella]|uniref:Uba/ThiF-type NAD/FAD-binding protein n=2 Tax=Segatella TaxID=2974251 RepID=D8DXT8_9BACT|nr:MULTISPECIES: tRNA threonylcarbamoyladenosine dehydratase [Segatella]MBQ3858127.1 tRNA threonylcarbamoyladenosine dehydratase [Prevotella sp.]EFI71716.1 Uba/ThiF-type NAD/FAD-binding protein [Segatella baroniae B14]UKK78694.1 tRNA threonylcarbamoyladenosine dehydratase [Segatella baroniae B14]SEQ37179.1 tRNA A37 threonylcarbamoyladenosine dehydratase [Segatella baroniae B14]GJG26979.1 tRNA threonylcarbamoyladenosine dehydratase [Segatella bryantii]